MSNKMISIVTTAAILATFTTGSGNVFASKMLPVSQVSKVLESSSNPASKEVVSATVAPFDLQGKAELAVYNAAFKMDSSTILSVTNNGGSYSGSPLTQAVDGRMDTHWETRNPNSTSFTNEVVFQLKETTELNRIVYAARQSSAKGKGFAQTFELYGSLSDEGNDYTRVTTGAYKGSTGDVVEIQFAPASFKRIKFVFTKANQDWASAAEFAFYKEDAVKDSMMRLFTDNTFSTVSEEFNSLAAIEQLESAAMNHPLYGQYQEDLNNARILVSNQGQSQAGDALVSSFETYYSDYRSAYEQAYHVDPALIAGISNNGGNYPKSELKKAIDGDINTHWETGKSNSASFKNEVVFEFQEPQLINRVMYKGRNGGKGFAKQFSIYASKTSKGDTFERVASGSSAVTNDVIEIQFAETSFKRLKFVYEEAHDNWASAGEFMFYTKDTVSEQVADLFTDGTMSALKPQYNSIVKIQALEEQAKLHPLYPQIKDQLERAKKIVNGELQTEGRMITAEQRGDMRKHAQQNLRFNLGSNNQPTGLVAKPGDTLQVYVDVDSNTKLPSIVLSQQEAAWNHWSTGVKLKPGKNTIVVPEFPSNNYYAHEVTKGGPIYISNPYTAEEQGRAPRIRIEGAEAFPIMTKDTDPAAFKSFLSDYKAKLDADKAAHPNVKDRQMINVVEVVSDRIVFTGTATEAYMQFITNNLNPMDTVKGYDVWIQKLFDQYGLDGRAVQHDPMQIRENIRLMQPYGAMYAAGDHTGIQNGTVGQMLQDFSKVYPGWGLTHEIGHRMAVGEREYGEVTNNMLSMLMSVDYRSLDNRIAFESIYKYVIEENKTTMGQQGLFNQLAAYWQLELAHPGYWKELNSLYRDRKVTLTSGDNSKQQYLVEFSSEVLGQDLSSFFARHGFTVNPETKQKVSQYPASKKLWYLNNSVVFYEGSGIANANTPVMAKVSINESARTNTLSLNIDQEAKPDLLGYEVYRNNTLVGFTGADQFIDKDIDPTQNYTYTIVAYDKKLKPLKPIEVKAFHPKLSVEEYVTLKLNQDFNPLHYVKATTYQGHDITGNVVVKASNVDLSKKGDYEVVYEVAHQGAVETRIMKVTVVSDYTYVSDLNVQSARVGWGSLMKDKAPSGSAIKLLRQGQDVIYPKGLGAHANSEIVYNIEGKGYAFFESYIGMDQAQKGNAASSATFELYVDGVKQFDSQVFRSGTDREYVKIPIANAKEIRLVTTDAKSNGNAADHTVWGDAKFITLNSGPALTIPKSISTKVGQAIDLIGGYSAIDPEDGDLTGSVVVAGADRVNFNRAGEYMITYSVTDSDGNTTVKMRTIAVVNMDDSAYLTDYDWKATQNSYTAPKKDISISNNALRLTDENHGVVSYDRGIGAHSNSTIIYDLSDKNYDYFTSFVGVDRQMYGSVGSVSFEVFVDGEKQFDSGVMGSKDPQKYVEIDINGAKELKLVVTDGRNGNGSDHATWGDAKLHYANANRVYVVELQQAIVEAKAIDLTSYTAESVAELTARISQAESILTQADATQTAIDAALTELRRAVAGLEVVDLTQVIHVVDPYLSQSIKNTLGLSGDITLKDMLELTSLTSETRRATSLEGLQYAKNLTMLDISGNSITDFSPLKDLTKLETLLADPQVVEIGLLEGAVVTLDNLVVGRDGQKVRPYVAAARSNMTFKEIELDTSAWGETPDSFTIDLSQEEAGLYTITLAYQVDGNLVMLIYMTEIKPSDQPASEAVESLEVQPDPSVETEPLN